MPRPKRTGRLSVRIDDETGRKIDEICALSSLDRADIVRIALEQGLNKTRAIILAIARRK